MISFGVSAALRKRRLAAPSAPHLRRKAAAVQNADIVRPLQLRRIGDRGLADSAGADKHRQELLAALHARPNIRRLARNTVMLTVLAVVHWNEKRLPEQRAELYESILGWLARSREQRPGRTLPGRALAILRELALAMQLHPDGRQVQVPRRWAAERIAGAFGDPADHRVVDKAECFLGEEEIDSGIVVARGHDIRFWHLTFQEYLAARAVGGRGEAEQRELLLKPPERFYAPEWKEVVLLLGGCSTPRVGPRWMVWFGRC